MPLALNQLIIPSGHSVNHDNQHHLCSII